MDSRKKPAQGGARSVSNRLPLASKKRDRVQPAAILEPEPLEQTNLLTYLHSDSVHDEMWKCYARNHGSPVTRILAKMDKALSGAFGIASLLARDERGLSNARSDAEEYTGLGDFYRGALANAQDVLLLEVCGGMDDLRKLAAEGKL